MSFLNKPWHEMTSGELHLSWAYWNDKVENATGWGAALVVADEFRMAAARELARRGDPIWPNPMREGGEK